VELIVSAHIALGKGVGVSLASLDPVSLSRSIQDESAAEALPGPDVRVRPNPFNPTTTIAFSLRAPGHVRVEVFDLRGRLVRVLRDSETAAGRIELDWHGDDTRGSKVGSGVYLVRIVSPDGAWTKRLALAK
jgi:flagellar hook assembly protein FlgD